MCMFESLLLAFYLATSISEIISNGALMCVIKVLSVYFQFGGGGAVGGRDFCQGQSS